MLALSDTLMKTRYPGGRLVASQQALESSANLARSKHEERVAEVVPGKSVYVPCRHCGKLFSYKVAVGSESVKCPRCSKATRVVATGLAGVIQIRTEPD